MKYTTLAFSALALAAGTVAQARSSSVDTATTKLSLYGILDANVQVLDGAKNQTRVQSGGLSGSRLGLRGSEDLGVGSRPSSRSSPASTSMTAATARKRSEVARRWSA